MTVNKKRGKSAAAGAVRYVQITTTGTSESLSYQGFYEIDFVTIVPQVAAGSVAFAPSADWSTRGTIALDNLVNGQVYLLKIEGKL